MSELKQQLEQLISSLIYLSESEAPFELIDISGGDKNELIEHHEKNIETLNRDFFFNNLIFEQDMSDEFVALQSQKYKTLYEFIKENFADIKIIKCGEVNKTVLIFLETPNAERFILKTHSVET